MGGIEGMRTGAAEAQGEQKEHCRKLFVTQIDEVCRISN
jgi:hypothetical protein